MPNKNRKSGSGDILDWAYQGTDEASVVGRWGVVLDAGSSGTRLHVYRWDDPARALKNASFESAHSLPVLKTKNRKWTKKMSPGVSSFGDHPQDVGPGHLQALVQHAVDVVPEHAHPDTPIFLLATAGMRLLPPAQQHALLSEICSYFRQNSRFYLPDCDLHVQVIPGETEGLYGWIAANYLLGGFDHPEAHAHGKGHHTYGFLDMGGASAQIAFAPNATEAEKHANDLKLLRMRTLNGSPTEYRVFATTWLGFGINTARDRYVERLVDTYSTGNVYEIPDPCMPTGLRTTESGVVIEGPSREPTLVGTGQFDECLRLTEPLLGKDMPCTDEPCLLNGQHTPAIDFGVNHFIGVSEFWYTTHGIFATDGKNTAYDFSTYQQKVEDFCSQDWDSIESGLGSIRSIDATDMREACFKASWLMNVMHKGIGIPREGVEHAPAPGPNATKEASGDAEDKGFLDPFQSVHKIRHTEVTWTLGRMVLYAAGQIPPQDDSLPVGLGSNVVGVPADFEYAGSNYTALDGDDDWADTAEDLLDQARSQSGSGFFLLVLILGVVMYVFRKRDRRKRVYGKVNSLLRRNRRSGGSRKNVGGLSNIRTKFFRRSSHLYERMLDDSEAGRFELGDTESDEGEYSDSSGGSQVGRSSGLSTPKLNVGTFDDLKKPSHPNSSVDWNGMVVRTESRDRLVPQMLNIGRRSRNGSPTRIKSPLMSPLSQE